MTFVRRVFLLVLGLCGFGIGTLLGVYNAQAVSFSLLVLDMPEMPLGLLVMAACFIGIVLGYLLAQLMRVSRLVKRG